MRAMIWLVQALLFGVVGHALSHNRECKGMGSSTHQPRPTW